MPPFSTTNGEGNPPAAKGMWVCGMWLERMMEDEVTTEHKTEASSGPRRTFRAPVCAPG